MAKLCANYREVKSWSVGGDPCCDVLLRSSRNGGSRKQPSRSSDEALKVPLQEGHGAPCDPSTCR